MKRSEFTKAQMAGTRTATRNDVTTILPLLKELHRESILCSVPIDEKKLHSFVLRSVKGRDRTCLIYQSASSAIEGILIGYTSEYFFSKEKAARDLVFYVRPERRGSLVAYRLWAAFKAWARAEGASSIWLGSAAGINPSRTRKFYRGLGMDEVGGIFRLSFERMSKPTLS